MAKNNKYSGEFKQKVVEYMLETPAGAKYTAKKFGLPNEASPKDWMRIYKERGMSAFYVEGRVKTNVENIGNAIDKKPKVKPQSFEPPIGETLEEEVERLRAENAYLKKLQALIQE